MPWEDLCPWALSGPSFHLFVLKHKVGQIPWRVQKALWPVCRVCVCVFAGNIPVLRQLKQHNLAPAASSPACVLTHTHSHAHIDTDAYIYGHIDTHTHTHRQTHMCEFYTQRHRHTNAHIDTCMHSTQTHTCIDIHTCTHIHMHVHTEIHIPMGTHKHTDTHMYTYTHAHTDMRIVFWV